VSERLFDLDEVPEVPLFREPRRSRGAQIMDERLNHEYPPEWSKCTTCGGHGYRWSRDGGASFMDPPARLAPDDPYAEIEGRAPWEKLTCPDCLGMGSVKARVRLEAGHRCVRCQHPFMTKGDAKMLGVEPSPGHWSPCDEKCTHGGPVRYRYTETMEWVEFDPTLVHAPASAQVEAEWKVLTVHHLDGDKANLRWWNLCALCQRCHLQIQGKVVMERVYPHEHSEWFKDFAAGYYAFVYLGEELTRAETMERLDELLALELAA
jgi:hypothetical protein